MGVTSGVRSLSEYCVGCGNGVAYIYIYMYMYTYIYKAMCTVLVIQQMPTKCVQGLLQAHDNSLEILPHIIL